MKSYPTSEVGAVAGRSYPTSKVRGGSWEELPHARGQGLWPRGEQPNVQEQWLCGHRRA